MKRREKIYSLAFRKRLNNNDFFFIHDDYSFEEYTVDTGGSCWLADPFLFEHGGKVYVFYEAFDMMGRKGRLGYSVLDPDTKTLTPPKIILDRSYHFSWPYIFEQDGEIYIMPETLGDYRVRLFRAVNFPDEWTEDEIIINDIYACDSILLEDGCRRYLLASETYHNTPDGEYASCRVKNVLFEFSPEVRFALKPTGKINPEGRLVSEGDYGIRNAGKIFRADGKLIRPGQNSRRVEGLELPPYGRGVVLFQIDSINPYSEHEIFAVDCDSITPHLKKKNAEKIIGLHTYNFSEHFEVIDFAFVRPIPLYIRIISKIHLLREGLRKVYHFLAR